MRAIPEVAHWLGLVPLVWLLLWGRRSREAWLLASAFGVSWVADTATHWVSPALVSLVYPVAQTGLVLLALVPGSIIATAFAAVLSAGLAGLWWPALPAADLLLRTVAWVGTVLLVWPRRDWAWRPVLLVAFGLGWVFWLGYHLWPGWSSWGAYQAVRLVSVGWFCVIVGRRAPEPVRVYATQ